MPRSRADGWDSLSLKGGGVPIEEVACKAQTTDAGVEYDGRRVCLQQTAQTAS